MGGEELTRSLVYVGAPGGMLHLFLAREPKTTPASFSTTDLPLSKSAVWQLRSSPSRCPVATPVSFWMSFTPCPHPVSTALHQL